MAQDCGIITDAEGLRMSPEGLSRAFAKVEMAMAKKYDTQPLPGPRAHLKKRPGRKRNAGRTPLPRAD